MNSWIAIFSLFTQEALLFEALFIFFLCASYAVFWVSKKRRLGSIKQEVPAGLVKTYLNELITEAEKIRLQLFGLLNAQAGAQVTGAALQAAPQTIVQLTTAAAGGIDPSIAKALEAKLAEQQKAYDAVLAEKKKLEADLANAKNAPAAAPGAAPAPAAAASGDMGELQKKIKTLEERLAEYSVIEDDLANLKKLQQENAQLRSQLGGTASAPATAPTPEPVAAAAPAAATAAPTPAPEAAAPAAATPSAEFEKVVDQVEAKIATPEPAAATAAPAATPEPVAAAAPASTAAPEAGSIKSEDDLLAEFEKMLNG